MNRNSPLEEKLDNWARNEITYDELKAFANNKGINQIDKKAELHKALLEGLHNERLRKQIEIIHREFAPIDKPLQKIAPVRDLFRQKWLLRVAASLFICIGLYSAKNTFFVSGEKLSENMFSEYYMVNERNENATGTGELISSFTNKEYERVIAIYEQNSDIPVREQFLAGYAYFNLNDFNNASKVFKSVIAKNKNASIPLYRDEAEYYTALCSLHTGNYDEAYTLFKNIRNNKIHTYHEKVSGLNLFRIRLKTF